MSAGRIGAQRSQRHHGNATRAGDADPATVTVHVPLRLRQRRGRKVLVAPEWAGQALVRALGPPTRTQSEVTPAVRVLARAFRWRTLLETGAIATVQEIAAAENINPSYVSRVLRLTLLAPEMVEALVAGTEAAGVTLDRLMLPFPIVWEMHTSVRY